MKKMFTKKKMNVLSKVFIDGIGKIPIHQGKGKVYDELLEGGFIKNHEITLKGFPPVTLRGFILTSSGHLEYCKQCSIEEENK